MSEETPPKGQRARRTCQECSRRKIKCDKNIPCATCVKRGLADSCRRLVQKSINVSITDGPTSSNTDIQSDPTLVQNLLDRVAQLEAVIKSGNGVSGLDQIGRRHDQGVGDRMDVRLESNRPSPRTNARPPAEGTLECDWTAPVYNTPTDTEASLDAILTPDSDPASNPEAAQVLEFLAWGRRKDQNFHEAPQNQSGPRWHHRMKDKEQDQAAPCPLIVAIRAPQLDVLEMVFPEKDKVEKLVKYHTQRLLWFHNSFVAGTFESEVEDFYQLCSGSIKDPLVNFQWLALLFSVLAGSITCASAKTLQSWGVAANERDTFSKRWFNGTVVCLNLSNYLQDHTIYSVQAISTLTVTAHILGFSNALSVLLAAANKIAQSLGLHRLGSENEDYDMKDLQNRRRREAGRRLWNQLCAQDWFSIPFSEMYSIIPGLVNTAKPLNCKDSDMLPLYQTTPTITSYSNYLFDIASLIRRLQDAMSKSSTMFANYEQVLAVDDQMRKLATSYAPTFLSTNQPMHETWPDWVPWARRAFAMRAAHKIIMIHRKFLGLSFTNNAFTFTRITCLAASKAIIKEAGTPTDEAGPVLWIDQAFTVAAAITLCLDAMHRNPDEAEYADDRACIDEAIRYLGEFPHNRIATRGIKLLDFLRKEIDARASKLNRSNTARIKVSNAISPVDTMPPPASRSQWRGGVGQPLTPDLQADFGATSHFDLHGSASNFMYPTIAEILPPQTGFGGLQVFNDFFVSYPLDGSNDPPWSGSHEPFPPRHR